MTEENGTFEYSGKIAPEFIQKARRMYDKYKADKAELNKRIIDNNKGKTGGKIYRKPYNRFTGRQRGKL